MAQFTESYQHEIAGKSVIVVYSGSMQLTEHNKDAARQMIVDAIQNGTSHDVYFWNNFNQLIQWSIKP